ncbi:DUF4041 domain-containing protein [Paenibacillus sp. Z6-24]
MKKWYLSTWFIGLLCCFATAVVPLIAAVILLLIRYSAEKKEYAEQARQDQEYQLLRQQHDSLESQYQHLQSEQDNLQQSRDTMEHQYKLMKNEHHMMRVAYEQIDPVERQRLIQEYEHHKQQLIELNDELLMQEFGLYEPLYDLATSEAYKYRLEEIRDQQKEMVRNKQAAAFREAWTVNGSEKEGKKMMNDLIKLFIRSFNNECDASIIKVKFNNINSIENRIQKSYDVLNKLGAMNGISITLAYLNSKLEELHLNYEYEKKKQEEKEEQARIREQMREEAKALKEIEAQKQKFEKEENHFNQAIEALKSKMQLENAIEQEKIQRKLQELEAQLAQVQHAKEDVINRERNTRAGYVYIISNIGSFGEEVYKIGMTRRLEPLDRIIELGDASVPFRFDVHAMIFSNDAPALENALHRRFTNHRLNKVNLRKEFFHVTLAEIEEEVRKNHNEVVQFTKLAEASEYRQSIQEEDIAV